MGITLDRRSYAPGLRQPRHAHEEWSLSIMIAGEVREMGAAGDILLRPGALIVKPPRVTHENTFGPGGARLLTVRGSASEMPADFAYRTTMLGPAFAAALQMHLRGEAPSPRQLRDLMALTGTPQLDPPSAVVLDAEQLLFVGSVGAIARRLKIHPVYLARVYWRHRGYSISEAVRRWRIQCALQLMAETSQLAEVALASGFCDQSHMNRQFRAHLGTTPKTFSTLAR